MSGMYATYFWGLYCSKKLSRATVTTTYCFQITNNDGKHDLVTRLGHVSYYISVRMGETIIIVK